MLGPRRAQRGRNPRQGHTALHGLSSGQWGPQEQKEGEKEEEETARKKEGSRGRQRGRERRERREEAADKPGPSVTNTRGRRKKEKGFLLFIKLLGKAALADDGATGNSEQLKVGIWEKEYLQDRVLKAKEFDLF